MNSNFDTFDNIMLGLAIVSAPLWGPFWVIGKASRLWWSWISEPFKSFWNTMQKNINRSYEN